MKNSTALILLLLFVARCSANADSQCCRKKIKCLECDSRLDPSCASTNKTVLESLPMVDCDDMCIKMKYYMNESYHVLRTCATSIKKIHIKKVDVCYASKDGGVLCFCEHDECNRANERPTTFYLALFSLISIVAFLLNF